MQSFLIWALLVGVPFVAGAPASFRDDIGVFARAAVEQRGTCNADNLLRLLRTPTNLPQALPFCSSYLHHPGSTSVVSTNTPIVLSTTTATVSLTDTVTSTITSIDTTVSTETATATATLTVTQQIAPTVRKRTHPKEPLSETVLSSYPASRISSACACLTIPVAVSLTTATAPAQTQILSTTTTVETTTTATETVLTTSTSATTVTTSTTSTATIAPPPVPTNFRLTGIESTGSRVYFNQLRYGNLYDILTPTANAAESLTFHLDASSRLWFQSTHYSAPVYAFYSDPYATNLRAGTSTALAMFAFHTDQWLASSSSPVYRGFTWSIDPYTFALTQTSFPGISLYLQSCTQNVAGIFRSVIEIGPVQGSNCATILSSLAVESI